MSNVISFKMIGLVIVFTGLLNLNLLNHILYWWLLSLKRDIVNSMAPSSLMQRILDSVLSIRELGLKHRNLSRHFWMMRVQIFLIHSAIAAFLTLYPTNHTDFHLILDPASTSFYRVFIISLATFSNLHVHATFLCNLFATFNTPFSTSCWWDY